MVVSSFADVWREPILVCKVLMLLVFDSNMTASASRSVMRAVNFLESMKVSLDIVLMRMALMRISASWVLVSAFLSFLRSRAISWPPTIRIVLSALSPQS